MSRADHDELVHLLATGDVDLASDEKVTRLLHDAGKRQLSRIPNDEWEAMIDEARALRIRLRAMPRLRDYAAAALCLISAWAWLVAQGPVS